MTEIQVKTKRRNKPLRAKSAQGSAQSSVEPAQAAPKRKGQGPRRVKPQTVMEAAVEAVEAAPALARSWGIAPPGRLAYHRKGEARFAGSLSNSQIFCLNAGTLILHLKRATADSLRIV